MEIVYHGSKESGLKRLEPRNQRTEHMSMPLLKKF